MRIAWNWLGILVWIAIVIYFVWIIFSIYRSGHRAITNDAHQKFIKKTVIAAAIRIIILIGATSGMLFIHFHSGTNDEYISINKSYQPMVLDTNGDNSYYVRIQKSKNYMSPQTYSYLTNGKRESIAGSQALLYSEKNDVGVPLLYSISPAKFKALDRRYQRAWSFHVVAKYKNNWFNGLALHANKIAGHHVLLRVPDKSFIYEEK